MQLVQKVHFFAYNVKIFFVRGDQRLSLTTHTITKKRPFAPVTYNIFYKINLFDDKSPTNIA